MIISITAFILLITLLIFLKQNTLPMNREINTTCIFKMVYEEDIIVLKFRKNKWYCYRWFYLQIWANTNFNGNVTVGYKVLTDNYQYPSEASAKGNLKILLDKTRLQEEEKVRQRKISKQIITYNGELSNLDQVKNPVKVTNQNTNLDML